MENTNKVISYMKKPRKVQLKDQKQIFKENRAKREAFLQKIKTEGTINPS